MTLLGEAFARDGADAWEARLLKAGVPAVRADDHEIGDFMLRSPQALANDLSIRSVLPDGSEFSRSAGCVEFSNSPVVHGLAAPLGSSTERVLRELGYDDAAIADLDARGITHPVGHGLDG